MVSRQMVVNKKLRKAFVALMARAGTPIRPGSQRGQGRRGPPERIYRLQDGRRLWLRTSATGPQFAISNKGATAEAAFGFEADDFLGLAFRSGRQAVGHLIPSAIAAQGIRATPPRGYRRDGHIWSFSVDDHDEWSAYRLGAIDFDTNSRGRGRREQLSLDAAITKGAPARCYGGWQTGDRSKDFH